MWHLMTNSNQSLIVILVMILLCKCSRTRWVTYLFNTWNICIMFWCSVFNDIYIYYFYMGILALIIVYSVCSVNTSCIIIMFFTHVVRGRCNKINTVLSFIFPYNNGVISHCIRVTNRYLWYICSLDKLSLHRNKTFYLIFFFIHLFFIITNNLWIFSLFFIFIIPLHSIQYIEIETHAISPT